VSQNICSWQQYSPPSQTAQPLSHSLLVIIWPVAQLDLFPQTPRVPAGPRLCFAGFSISQIPRGWPSSGVRGSQKQIPEVNGDKSLEASLAPAPSGERKHTASHINVSMHPQCVCARAHTCSDTMAQRPSSREAYFVLLTRGL
jgi:hypothetical protein